MNRTRDNLVKADAFLAERMCVPFQWGVSDCALFAADFVQAVTSVDYAVSLRGTYDTEAGAYNALAMLGPGFSTLKDFMEDLAFQYNWPSVRKSDYKWGDVVLIEFDRNGALPALGIIVGPGVLAQGVLGLIEMSREQTIIGWEVR